MEERYDDNGATDPEKPSIKGRTGAWIDTKLSQETRKDLVYIGLILLVICIFFWKVILYPQNMIFSIRSDTVTQFYPWRVAASESGLLPLWNPYTFGGEPLLANPQLAYFYPPNIILFTIFPDHLAFGYGFILHLFIASSSMYFLGRRLELSRVSSLFIGMTFVFSGYFMGHVFAAHYPQTCSASLIPAIFLLFDTALRRNSWKFALATGILVGCQFLAGHIQITLMTGFVLVSYFVYHMIITWKTTTYKNKLKLTGISAVAALLSILVTVIQFIPSYQYTSLTTRSGGVGYSYATSYSLPPANLIMLFTPNIMGQPLNGTYWGAWSHWELSMYMGIITLIFFPFAIHYRKNSHVRFFAGMGILSIILAMGGSTPVYWIFYKLIPGFDLLRGPARFVVLFIFSLSILAGFGFDHLQKGLTADQMKKINKKVKVLVWISLIILSGSLIVYLFQDRLMGTATDVAVNIYPDASDLSDELSMMILDIIVFAVFLGLSSILLVWRVKKKQQIKFFQWGVIALIVVNLGYYHNLYIDSKDPDDIYSPPEYIRFLQQNSNGYRIYDSTPSDVELIKDNFQIMYGLHTVKGYNPLHLKNYEELFESIRNLSNNQQHPVLDLLNVRYIISHTRLNDSGFDLAYQDNSVPVCIYENPRVLQKAFFIENYTVIPDDGVLERIRSPGFDPRISVLLSEEPDHIFVRQENETSHGENRVDVLEETNTNLKIRAQTINPGFLVIGQTHYPNWQVYVEGEERDLHLVYHALSGVYLEPGENEVELVFRRIF